jgi:hypothetical protein
MHDIQIFIVALYHQMEANTLRQDQDVDVEVCDLANTIDKLKLELAPLSFLYSQPIFYDHELQHF